MELHTRVRALGALSLATMLVASAGAVSAQSPAPSMDPAASAEPIPTLSAACAFDQLQTKTAGRLTIGADNPAYPPWFGGQPAEGSIWDLGDPTTGEGFEAAIATAVAETLGFTPDLVDWKQVPFVKSFAPGAKAFDMYITQVSIRPKRAEAVDFSDPYYFFNQAIIALSDNPIVGATSVEALKGYRLGAQTATTSLDTILDVVAPSEEPRVYADNDKALRALKNGAIDGLVVDLPTAFYMRDAQLEDWDTPDPEATIVGQFPLLGTPEALGIVLEKESPLTACVNEALAIIRASGAYDAIYDQWLGAIAATPVPFFEGATGVLTASPAPSPAG